MKTTAFFVFVFMTVSVLHAQVTHTVSENGFSYDPATLTIQAGESVKFEGTASHPIKEVSETTWESNGATPLEGGFSLSSGSGTVNFPEPGTHYYVCTAHVAANGMKGKIIVQTATALDDVSATDQFAVYPLPLTGDELTVNLKSAGSEQISVDIYDLAGTLRISSGGNLVDEKYQINCSSLPRGIFLVKIRTDGEELIRKVVKL